MVNGLGRYLIRATINDDLLHVLYQRRCQRLIMSEMLSRSARKRPRDDYEGDPPPHTSHTHTHTHTHNT